MRQRGVLNKTAPHRALRFAFWGIFYEDCVLPFSLLLGTREFRQQEEVHMRHLLDLGFEVNAEKSTL